MRGENSEWRRSGGCFDCGGKCPYRVKIEKGRAIAIEPCEELRPCVRGYGLVSRVYSPDRLKVPLRRSGPRGKASFREVSWGEALDEIAERLLRVRDTFGSQGILFIGSSGAPGRVHTSATVGRLLNMFGGYTARWGSASAEGAYFAAEATFGVVPTGHTKDDVRNSKLAILWGWNPAETVQGTDTFYNLIKARESGTRFVVVDPRFTNTAAVLADDWIPIRPGTDCAVLLAMAFVIVKDDIQNKGFIDIYVHGFDEFKEYLLGNSDGIPKTPQWAEAISGISAGRISHLAKQYGLTKPSALIPGFAPGRTAYGEQFHRAAAALAAITGNIGISGGGAACCEIPQIGRTPGANLDAPSRVGAGRKLSLDSLRLNPRKRSERAVNTSKLWDAVMEGRDGGFPSDPKLVYVACANPVNQYPNSNKAVKAFQQAEFVVVHEQFMTATAKFADVVLPVTTHWERSDIMRPWLGGTYFFYAEKVIDPLYSCKSDMDICRELATRLGIEGYSEITDEGWVDKIAFSSTDSAQVLEDSAHLREKPLHFFEPESPVVAFEKEITDPASHPFPTPTGKIEIFSTLLAELGDPLIPPLPTYIPCWEGSSDSLSAKYPLQLVTFHAIARAHSCFHNIQWLKELEPHRLWMSRKDARDRGIGDGEVVHVFNDRGCLEMPTQVTERILPGVVALGEGAWFCPDASGVDKGGCANVLTRDCPSPAGALASNTSLVEVTLIKVGANV